MGRSLEGCYPVRFEGGWGRDCCFQGSLLSPSGLELLPPDFRSPLFISYPVENFLNHRHGWYPETSGVLQPTGTSFHELIVRYSGIFLQAIIKPMVVWNQSWWECLHPTNGQIPHVKALLPPLQLIHQHNTDREVWARPGRMAPRGKEAALKEERTAERLRERPKGQLWLPHKMGRGSIWIYLEV